MLIDCFTLQAFFYHLEKLRRTVEIALHFLILRLHLLLNIVTMTERGA